MNSVIFMKLIIIRHGDPDYEHDTLTQKGVREAKLLSERISKLDVKAFYCSPLGRAQDTASYTLDKMNRSAQTLPWLCEFEGKILSGLKYISCWDRLPSEWTKYPEHYDYNEWYNSKMLSVNIKRYATVLTSFLKSTAANIKAIFIRLIILTTIQLFFSAISALNAFCFLILCLARLWFFGIILLPCLLP